MEGCGPSASKLFLIFINLFIFMIGGTALGIGIWCCINQSSLIAIVNTAGYLTPSDLQGIENVPSMIEVGYIILIGIGGFIFFVGFSGCMGALKESKCLLWIYAFFVLVSFLFLLASGILGALFNDELDTSVQQFMLSTLNYSFDGMVNSSNPQSTGWYAAMQMFQCCGYNGPTDFSTNYTQFSYNWSSTYRQYCAPDSTTCVSGAQVVVPTSCCMYTNGQYWNASAMVNYNCPTNPTAQNSYTQGCQSALTSWLNSNSILILAVAFGLAGFMMIAMVAACCMIQAMDSEI